ncbi:hypothetical protein E9228_000906 [Curtobacterium flaccumfaciens]|uniref:Uncharacterized protein n=1 Tax=Curtobacterium salicis TaxID=1779862 RepID=A0ABX0T446_9MICO|nr:hypothetical protein [Curtobacterium sp. WW7]NII40270.1 hypothetical protein [Curtobacterium sp. WW7]
MLDDVVQLIVAQHCMRAFDCAWPGIHRAGFTSEDLVGRAVADRDSEL